METLVKESVKYYELSYPQKRILRIENMYSGTPVCNIGGIVRIKGNINLKLFMQAVGIYINANESLRLRIVEHGGEVCQYVHKYVKEPILFKDFSNLSDSFGAAEKWAQEIFNIPFKLIDSNLYRTAIYKAGENQYGILCSLHHIIADGWSTCIFQKRIMEIYLDLLSGKGEDEVIKEPSYINFLEKERKYIDSNRFLRDKEYFKEVFSNVNEEFLYNSENSSIGIRESFNLSPELSIKIKNFLSQYNVSINTFFTLIMSFYLEKKVNTEEIVLGNLSFNRMTKKERATLGMCANIMPLKLKIDKECNSLQFLDSISVNLKRGFYHQQYPYNKIIEDLALKEKGYDSLFRFRVNCYKSDYATNIGDGHEVEIEEYYNGHQNYSSQIITKEIKENNIILCIDYKPDEYSKKDIKDMYDYIINTIERVIEKPESKIKFII